MPVDIRMTRSVDPWSLTVQATFDSSELRALFARDDQELFYLIYSPALDSQKPSEKLGLASRLAAVVEAQGQLALSGDAPEKK